MSGWLDTPTSCKHPGRPTLKVSDRNRVWHCSHCDRDFRVMILDYGHNVKPGEPHYSLYWESGP